MAKILIVEDDQALSQMVATILQRDRHDVESAYDGKAGCDKLLAGNYDLAVLDWELPGMNGVNICMAARTGGLKIPILMLTSRARADDTEQGLDAGADDYLTKPFAPLELSARIKALLRRPNQLSANEIECGNLRLCLRDGRAFKNGEALDLMPTEYALLEFLMRNQGKAFSAEQLADHVWKSDAEATYAAVAACISRLRLKIDDSGRRSLIKTLHGIGYVLEE